MPDERKRIEQIQAERERVEQNMDAEAELLAELRAEQQKQLEQIEGKLPEEFTKHCHALGRAVGRNMFEFDYLYREESRRFDSGMSNPICLAEMLRRAKRVAAEHEAIVVAIRNHADAIKCFMKGAKNGCNQ